MDKTVKNSLQALIIYWSGTGNTEKVARAIHESLVEMQVKSTLKVVTEASGEDLHQYDWIFIGAPSHSWLPPKPMLNYIENKMKFYREKGVIQLCAPKVPGKKGVVFCTYSGPHTGINEAIPVGKYIGQFLEHIGFEVVGEWYVPGEFHGHVNRNIKGKLGDIRGRPNQQDLDKVKADLVNLLRPAR
ncbi:flavodoxin family protein [Chloroflexota bacterium]